MVKAKLKSIFATIMTRSLILGIMFFAMGLATGSYAQANSYRVPSSDSLNTITPANLSWVVGRFEVISVEKGVAKLHPTFIGLLPDIEVRFDSKFLLKQGDTLNITIRDGNISSIK